MGPPQAWVTSRPRTPGKKRSRSRRVRATAVRSTSVRPPTRPPQAIEPARPAEDDAPVARGPRVVQEGARVGDRLAARPAELLEDVGHRLGGHDVAGGDGEAVAQRRDPGGRRVHRQHRVAGVHAPVIGLGDHRPRRHGEAPHARVLVDGHAAREQPVAQALGQAGGLHRRAVAQERAAAQHRRGAARPDLLGASARRSGRARRARRTRGPPGARCRPGRARRRRAARRPRGTTHPPPAARTRRPAPRPRRWRHGRARARPRRRSARAARPARPTRRWRSRRCARSGPGRRRARRGSRRGRRAPARARCQAVHIPR